MTSYEAEQSSGTNSLDITGDVVGGIILAVLGLLHLFLIQLGGGIGIVVLFFVWPLIAGAIGAYYDLTQRPDRSRALTITGAVSGVFGAVAVGIIVFVAGVVSIWSGFITDTFGSGLMATTLGLTFLLIITWTVSAFVAGYIVREAAA